MSKFKVSIFILSLLSFVAFVGFSIYNTVLFNMHIGNHIKLAAVANTVDIAKSEMEIIVGELEKRNMTSGYTSVLYNTPDEDVGFWYNNLKASLRELNQVKPDSSQLEQSNVLMKLRETLQGHIPDGISKFPNNIIYAVWGWMSLVTLTVTLFASRTFRNTVFDL